MSQSLATVEDERAIEHIVDKYFYDPYGYVCDVIGAIPDVWQTEALHNVAKFDRNAVASGHGVGKTALVAWIIHWFMATRIHPQIVVTANTKPQLDTKTWRELAKWNKRAANGHWFNWTATRFSLIGAEETWYASAIPWSEHNSEAFAGTHEENVLVIFDEASAIADIIWDVVEGAMTTKGSKWVAFGNPTRNTGRFRECFGRQAHRWHTMQVDSRTAKMADKKLLNNWIEDYGEDSDFVRIRVRGVFPRAASSQFISSEDVMAAMKRELSPSEFHNYERVLGVDVARFGDDKSVILRRQGPKVWQPKKFRGIDTMELSSFVADDAGEWGATAIFVDGIGVGSGVVDRLRMLNLPIVDVNVGTSSSKPEKYANLRTELWGEMRNWLPYADLPNDHELADDLISPEYGFNAKMQITLERKESMKQRGLASPDIGDALAVTFAPTMMLQRKRGVLQRIMKSAKGWT